MSSFPALLRRSNIAIHDPYITRVYSASPAALSASDFGLKFPVHRARRSPFIKVARLDAGPGLGADWVSGEGEARFVDAWGSGRVAWSPQAEPAFAVPRASVFAPIAAAHPAPAPRWVPDVNAMTEPEFARYLEHVRARRASFRDAQLGPGGRGEGAPTLASFARSERARASAATDFQVELARADAASPDTPRIAAAAPHATYGLTYAAPSRAAMSAARLPGRRIERGNETNEKHVAVIGSVGAQLRTPDRTSTPVAVAQTYRVTHAHVAAPPSVLGIDAAQAGARWTSRVSAARRARPMDTCRFNIEVDGVPEGEEDAAEFGSREYVGGDARARAIASEVGSAPLFGGPRALRKQGAAAEALKKRDDRVKREASADIVKGLLGRLTQQAALAAKP
ncbi:hypothetical protein Q5752_001949 [Cryptotrichosporon argae]